MNVFLSLTRLFSTLPDIQTTAVVPVQMPPAVQLLKESNHILSKVVQGKLPELFLQLLKKQFNNM